MGARYLWFEEVPIAKYLSVRPFTRLLTILIARWICRRRGEKQFGIPWGAIVVTSALRLARYVGMLVLGYVVYSLLKAGG
jgi:hypothetical protein